MSLKILSLTIATALLFTQCAPRTARYISVKHHPPVQYHSFNSQTCNTIPDKVYVFHKGEPLQFNYKRLGQITYDGAPSHERVSATQYLQYEAAKHCANGIIITNNQVLNIPTTFDTADGSIANIKKVNLTAVAIYIETDSLFLQQNGQDSDQPTFKTIESQTDIVHNPEAGIGLGGVLIGLLLLGIIVGSAAGDLEDTQ